MYRIWLTYRKEVGSEWLFKRKRDADGNVERYKAGLVAQGFTYSVRLRDSNHLEQ